VDELTQLALAARAGDEEALAALIRRTQADVWRLCAHLAGHGRADDLTQETFLGMWRSLGRYRAQSSARTWLLTIARYTAVDALRAARRRPENATLLDDVVDRSAPVADPADLVTIERLVAALDPDRRLALVLTQILGLSYAEAAAVCAVPVGTIRSRVARGRTDLLARLGCDDADERDGIADGDGTGSLTGSGGQPAAGGPEAAGGRRRRRRMTAVPTTPIVTMAPPAAVLQGKRPEPGTAGVAPA